MIIIGWEEVDYERYLGFFGVQPGPNAQAAAVRLYQQSIVSILAGLLGMIFCISATSFFVPRMLERGSADISFSKPVSRVRLLLARYFAGILFVTLLALFLVGGTYLGLTLRSGYHDPGFLWSGLTLVYLFAILHSVSTMIGVITRSTVAAILVTILFFWFNGCIQQGWITYEYIQQKEVASALRGVEDLPPGLVIDVEDGPENEKQAEASEFFRKLFFALKVLHYIGPKTTDAGFISTKFLAAIRTDELLDEQGKLTVEAVPAGFERTSDNQVNLAETPGTWTYSLDGRELGRVELSRRSRTPPGQERRLSGRRAARAYVEELAPDALLSVPVEDSGGVDRTLATFLHWKERGPEGTRARQRVFFTFGDWLFELDATFDPEAVDDTEPTAETRAFIKEFKFARDVESLGQNEW